MIDHLQIVIRVARHHMCLMIGKDCGLAAAVDSSRVISVQNVPRYYSSGLP